MSATKHFRPFVVLPFAAGVLLFTGCGADDGANLMATYELSVRNVTAAQPLSPPALVIHRAAFEAWSPGATASAALENMAEGGSPAALVAAAEADGAVMAALAAPSPIGPGASASYTLTGLVATTDPFYVTMAGMLVHTNDAFAGIMGVRVDDMAVGSTRSLATITYDAGTELDDELGAQIPGPNFGGAGFNAARTDPVNRVRVHSGVRTPLDGLPSSNLGEQHRWLDPAVLVQITRTQ